MNQFVENAHPANETKKARKDMEVTSCNRKGVMANQRTVTTPAATMPIGHAAKSAIQGEGCLSGFQEELGTKSGEIGMAPR